MLRLTKRGAGNAQQKWLRFERFKTLENHHFELETTEIMVLILFRGSLRYKNYKNKDGCSLLGPNSGVVVNYLGMPQIIDFDIDLEGLMLRIDVNCMQKILSELKYRADLTRFVNEPLNFISIPKTQEIDVLLCSFDLYSNRSTFFSNVLLYESKLLELFWLLNDCGKLSFDRFAHQYLIPDRNFLDSIMNKYFRENLSLNQYASIAGFSVSTFKRKFVEAYQCSPKRWVQNKRLNEAKALLEFSDKTISEIGYEVGFESISHFIHSFKLKFGVTPKNLREQKFQDHVVRIAS